MGNGRDRFRIYKYRAATVTRVDSRSRYDPHKGGRRDTDSESVRKGDDPHPRYGVSARPGYMSWSSTGLDYYGTP